MATKSQKRNPLFGKRLKQLRESHELTQKEFAEQIGITGENCIQTISAWETSRREPSFATLVKIADFFGVTTDYLLGRSQERKTNEILLLRMDDLNEKQKQALLLVIDSFMKQNK